MSLQRRPIHPSSLKARFASRFLRALMRIKKSDRSSTAITTPSSTRDISRKSHLIKIASYTSMASAVGSKRAWTRAVLQKARNRTAKHGLIRKRRIMISTSHALRRRKKKGGGDQRKRNPIPKKENRDDDEFGAELRKLVPGGGAMDMCKLLDETAHYIRCLPIQIEVMRDMVNFFSK